jgi:hypothetical protein
MAWRYKGKKRYNLFRAEVNQKWEAPAKKLVEQLCKLHGLDPEIWFDDEVKKTRRWWGAYEKLDRFLKDNGMSRDIRQVWKM